MASQDTGISTMDVMAAAFFFVAGAWLIIAILYSALVLVFLRLRSRGELSAVYEEEFGRLYLFRTRYYIPFGCLFRRYLRHLQAEVGPQNNRFMTRAERRAAMETLLVTKKRTGFFCRTSTDAPAAAEPDIEAGSDDDASSSQEPVCSICLGEYEQGVSVLASKTCSHQFHTECILDWLQRQEISADCPCCRVPMADEDDVWRAVKKIRKEKRRQLRQKGKAGKDDVEISETCEDEDFDDVEQQITGASEASDVDGDDESSIDEDLVEETSVGEDPPVSTGSEEA